MSNTQTEYFEKSSKKIALGSLFLRLRKTCSTCNVRYTSYAHKATPFLSKKNVCRYSSTDVFLLYQIRLFQYQVADRPESDAEQRSARKTKNNVQNGGIERRHHRYHHK